MNCKITNEKIEPFMSFGKMPLANGFLKEEDFKSEFFYEMSVGFSKKLSLFQLNEFPNPNKIMKPRPSDPLTYIALARDNNRSTTFDLFGVISSCSDR